MIEVYAKSDIGSVRSNNQDAVKICKVSNDCAWSILCDGMGGMHGGNIASALAIETIAKVLETVNFETLDDTDVAGLLCSVIDDANEAVFKKSLEDDYLKGMGTTVAIVIVNGSKLYTAHVGDSRVYLKNEQGVSQITKDHSYVQELVDSGQITEDEAKKHPHRNIITRSVGARVSTACDVGIFNISQGDVVISCSDGLSSYLDEDTTLTDFIENSSQKIIVDNLVKFANDCGGNDNITVCAIYKM